MCGKQTSRTEEPCMPLRYEKPTITDFGSIGEHTFKATDCPPDPRHNLPSCPYD